MPFGGGRTLAVNVSGLIWDADLVVPAARIITVDHIAETTPAHGVVANNNFIVDAGVGVQTNHLTEVTGGHGVTIAGGIVLHADHVGETTGAHGTVVDQVLTGADNCFMKYLYTDHVKEVTGAHNVVIDNTETGRQIGTGASTTGAVLAHTHSAGTVVAVKSAPLIVRRAGTYKVKVYNEVAFGGGGYIALRVNDVTVDQTTANNGARTDEDLGDQVLAVGDIVQMIATTASPANQACMLSFYNADGMWQ